MKRREFSREDKGAMLRRSRDEKGRIRCEGCGIDLTGKHMEFDHTTAEALVIDKAKKLTPADGKLLGRDCCHRAPGGKTAQDMARITKAKRVEAKHIGLRNKGANRLRGPGFRKTENVRWRSASELARMGDPS